MFQGVGLLVSTNPCFGCQPDTIGLLCDFFFPSSCALQRITVQRIPLKARKVHGSTPIRTLGFSTFKFKLQSKSLGRRPKKSGQGLWPELGVCVCESQCVRSDETDSFVITYTPPCLQGVKSLHPPPCHCVSLTYTLNHQLEQIGWAFQRIPSKRCISKKGARGINLSYPKCCVGPS